MKASGATSDIGKDLKRVRNVKPLWSRFGTPLGIVAGGLDMWLNTLFGWSPFGTLKHGKPDYAALEPARNFRTIDYPKPDGVLTFDRLSSVFLSNTNHEEDQPMHLQVKNRELQKTSELEVYGGPSTRYCPAGVYEWVDGSGNARPQASRRTGRALRDQRAELRPLQDVRHQGPEPEHQLGAAAGRRGPGLPEHVAPRRRRAARRLRPRSRGEATGER